MAKVKVRCKAQLVVPNKTYWYQRWAVLVYDGDSTPHVPLSSSSYIDSWHFFKIGALLRALEFFMEKQ